MIPEPNREPRATTTTPHTSTTTGINHNLDINHVFYTTISGTFKMAQRKPSNATTIKDFGSTPCLRCRKCPVRSGYTLSFAHAQFSFQRPNSGKYSRRWTRVEVRGPLPEKMLNDRVKVESVYNFDSWEDPFPSTLRIQWCSLRSPWVPFSRILERNWEMRMITFGNQWWKWSHGSHLLRGCLHQTQQFRYSG